MPRILLAATLLPALLACAAAPSGIDPSPARPRMRTDGPRAVAFSGGDPQGRGWTKADDLLWVEAADAEALREGRLRVGPRFVSFAEADALRKTPLDGYVLRTDHFVVRTNVGFEDARRFARLAETHLAAVLREFGDALDLRVPQDPFPLVVAARRAEFRALLRAKAPPSADWSAFYVASEGTVYVSAERSIDGGLPVEADIRHETTHAILDLGRPPDGRDALFGLPHFWLWEGIATWCESLGDPPGRGAGTERLERFRARLRRGESEPLARLFALHQADFEGRHYDQAASFTTWLLQTSNGARRPGALALLRRVMAGVAELEDFETDVALSPEDAERAWLAWVQR